MSKIRRSQAHFKMADEKAKTRKCSKVYKNDLEKTDDDQANSGNGLKRKQSRKELRKEFRTRKKARVHACFSSRITKQTSIDAKKNESELETTGGKCIEKSKKKKKRKKPKHKQIHVDSQHEFHDRDWQSTKVFKNEDQEIEELEKKLKLNKKAKLPKEFFEEGLNDILEVCDAIDQGNYAGGIYDDSKNESMTDGESDDSANESEGDIDDGVKSAWTNNGHVDGELDNKNESEEEGWSEDSSKRESEDECENSDVIDDEFVTKESFPKSSDIYGGASAKYVPPHQRVKNDKEQTQHDQVRERLRKQVKGLLNRLSESNISVVSGQIEELYMSNSRNDLNEILSSLIMDACISSSLMPEGLLREHVMLIAILNSLVGSEVGAFLLQKLAVQFEDFHSADKCRTIGSKEIHNVVTLFAFLYSFKVIDCVLIYDIIRQLVASFLEQDMELILLLIRLIGVEIRRESPDSLKEIILEVQAKAAADTELRNTCRTRFMLETVTALRNNNIRKIPNYDPSQTDRARKILKKLIHDTGQNDNSKLSISLSDLLSADSKGRWWIVGSAWSERETKNASVTLEVPEVIGNGNILELARQQRMNTEIRRNIFCIVMTSEDYVDAFEKLMRLKLKDKQSREIVHVLMDCSLQEKTYNPFYSYLIQKFCEFSRSYQVTVQYSLWDRFKMASDLTDLNLTNMSHLLVHLLVTKSLSLSVLKVVDFTSLDKRLVTFFTEMLTHLLLDYQESATREVFKRIAPLTKLDTLKESLKLFMKHFLKPKKSISWPKINNKFEKVDKERTLEERINVAIDALSGS